ncbi:esterase [Chryseobacterium sp. StRB126]|uniref:alpha/beta hydrolase-fold protein n=1 Tax=Chryseobacterium sp. StRB126 TaxID=878220 RepID=UPI0004E99751|nr:alpha/beta hydrolase-fold protein [Chryseobacterium sp. StRB126]BAP31534.1 esterase [Chryseobacterium sp. StRB126]
MIIDNGKTLAYQLILIIVLVVSSINLSYSQEPLPARKQISKVFHSKVLNEERQFWIYLPEGYDRGEKLYPVIYLLDPDQNFAYVTEMERFLSDRYRMPKSIVVGIVNADRVRDFTPVHSMTFHGKFDNSLRNTGGAEKFLSFLKQEAIPFIESNFRTVPYRTLEGHSLGGLFSLYCKKESPELFQSYIIISPAIYDGNTAILTQFREALQKNVDRTSYLYLSIGDEPDGLTPVKTLNESLKKYADKNLIWDFKQYHNEDHFSVGYQSMYDGLKFIYSKWFLNPRDASKVKSYLDIKTHFDALSKLYGYEVIPDEDLVNESGYQRLNNNDFVHAIEIFAENVKNNPESANAYDSLGEAFMKNGNKHNAIENYEKSIKLNPHNQNAVHMLQELKK